jgi:hypothetical protein
VATAKGSLHIYAYREGCGSGSAWIRIQIADPDAGGQKWPTKIEKSTEFSCFEVLDVLGLKASPSAWAYVPYFMEA